MLPAIFITVVYSRNIHNSAQKIKFTTVVIEYSSEVMKTAIPRVAD
jgi:hypothetical protein